MARVDQRGFDNQRSWLSAREALDLLGVRAQTLYAYVSRGLVRSVRAPGERTKRYAYEDLARLRKRHDARSGHGPVAAGALRWGEPVLESSITEIRADGPYYRGESAIALLAEGRGFEAVAELLWGGEGKGGFPRRMALPPLRIPSGAEPFEVMLALVPAMALADRDRFQMGMEAERARARSLIRALAVCSALAPDRVRAGGAQSPGRSIGGVDRHGARDRRRLEAALAADSIASAMAIALRARGGARGVRAIDLALVASADHELNASAFAARVAASAGADLYASVTAALATLSGPRHGGMCDRVEALLDEVAVPRRAESVLRARLRRGESVPGFGHPLYPGGDPRARSLLEAARTFGARTPRLRLAEAIASAGARLGIEPPALDLGLVAIAAALDLDRGGALAMFAVGRCAGWVAHIFEQRAQGFMVRPRARYVPSDRSASMR